MDNNHQMDTQNDGPIPVDHELRIAIQSMAATAHDMRNLLTGILLLAERIASESEPRELGISSMAHRIIEGGKRMQQSINRLIDTAAGEEIGEHLSLRKTCCLLNLLRQVVKSNWVYAVSKGIRLRWLDLGPRECWGHVDEERLRMALDNLVNNAIKFSTPGTEIQVSLVSRQQEGEPFALIQVKDQGPGLTSEDKAKAFRSFQKLSAKPTAGEHSTGLGLSIVRRTVENHGGKVWVESEHGQGATFCIDLPLNACRL